MEGWQPRTDLKLYKTILLLQTKNPPVRKVWNKYLNLMVMIR